MSPDTPAAAATGDLESLLTTLQGDLKALPAAEAVPLIDRWQATLIGSGASDLATVAEELGRLKDALSGGSPDAARVRASLSRLSELVCEIADADQDTRLIRLGDALGQAAQAF